MDGTLLSLFIGLEWYSSCWLGTVSLTINLIVLQPKNPRKCWSLPGFCSRFEGGVFACTLSWGSYYRPPLFTPSFTRSIWCGQRGSTVPPQGMDKLRTLNHFFSHALCPTVFWVWRSIGRLPHQGTSSFRPFKRGENCVDCCCYWQGSHWSCQEWWCFWETGHYDHLGRPEGHGKVSDFLC